MPLYAFTCECGYEDDFFLEVDSRNERLKCPKCQEVMRRVLTAPKYHGEPYQMRAILSDGSRVAGHFGREAPRMRGK